MGLGALLVFGSALAPLVFAGDPHAVLLLYHRFGEDQHPSTSVTLDELDAHLEHLATGGYTVLPLATIVDALGGKGELPDRAVAITVDDGYLSVYEELFPRLKARGWPFTVFLCTDPIDAGLGGYMSWDQLREMAGHGASYGHHSASHAHLVERRKGESEADWRKRVQADIERGARRLTAELGETTLFAYPYGEYDTALAAIVRELGFTGFGQQSGAVGPTTDRRALPRFPMAGPYAELDDFKVKVATLPFPIESIEPWDPRTRDRQPTLEVTLGKTDARLDQLSCFVSGQGRVEPTWLEKGRRFSVRAAKPLPPGRGRYNCTAPSGKNGRFLWFSQQWVVTLD